MGSLRNPVGPLPSTIYWRRRVVLLSVLVLLALLITWIVTSSGGGGKKDDGANGKTPAPTISAGPSSSGPAISQAPGGRDESSGGGSGSDAGGTGSGGSSGSGDGGGSGAASGGSGGSGGTSGGGTGSGVGQGDTVPAGSTLPNCTAGAVKLSVRSLHNTYSPGDTVTLLVTAKNSSGGDCKVDLGPKSAVLTISKSTDSADDYWSSADCPKTAGSLLFRAPAGSGITYTVKWDRKPSAPECATPPAGSAGAGTYLVELAASGYGKTQTSFVLKND
ncbi:hypothetical protein ACFY2T_34165 [Streptomyces sp. NPDC001260]|uniref:DUF4232 domain-containing protein n=1 Tax=Streptomyces gilvifuscus TaxID=1550617 RepID=A0ABT5G1Z8_9ACTN|nr:hypothetical protein [Streptomyces gilvifuscus]MDC2958829.1 hypothetical protein [Streptomyces gilvifuscus]